MSSYSAYKTDSDLEAKGFWFTDEGGGKWLLRSSNARRVRDAWDVARAPYAGMLQRLSASGKQTPPDVEQKITVSVLMGGIVADCTYTNEQEETCTYDKNKTTDFLRGLPYLCNDLLRAANDFHNYLEASRIEDLKNSDAPSSTISNGGAASTNLSAESTPA